MHTLTHLACIFFVYKYANLQKWRLYHSTLLYICAVNLLYNFLCANYDLWKYKPDIYSNHTLTEVGNSVILLPAIAFIFLSHYPEKQGNKKVLLYYLKWVFLSFLIETIFVYFGKITFHHGYKFWMEPFFYFIMYTFIRLHYKHPLLTYILSVFVVIILLLIFKIPVNTPIDNRH